MSREEEGLVLLRLQPRDLNCTICLSRYRCPCTLPCGHTFCLLCIQRCWEGSARATCPVCQSTFQARPELHKSTDLASLVETLRAQEKPCQSCTGTGAQGLCLSCMAPLCPEHLPLHGPDTECHLVVSLPPTASEWPCRQHSRGLQFFCVPHGTPVCPTCVLQHEVCGAEPLAELYRRKKDKILKRIKEISSEISIREEEISSKKHAYCQSQVLVWDMKENLSRDFRAMRDYLEVQEGAAFWRIAQEQDTERRRMEEGVAVLSADIDRLTEARSQLEDRLHSHWIEVLKDTRTDENTDRPHPVAQAECVLENNRIVDTAQAISRIKRCLLSHPLLEPVSSPSKQVLEDVLAAPAPDLPEAAPSSFIQDGTSEPPDSAPSSSIQDGTTEPPEAAPSSSIQDGTTEPPEAAPSSSIQDGTSEPPEAAPSSSIQDGTSEPPEAAPSSSIQDGTSEPPEAAPSSSIQDGTSEPPEAAPSSCIQDLTPNHPVSVPHHLLQWSRDISFDPQTMSCRLSLSPDLRTVKVTGKSQPYPKAARRFTSSQVLCSEGFSSECSYWEVRTNSSNSWAIGVASVHIAKDDRLGRNDSSWCLEWSKDQLSSWHGNQEIRLCLPRPEIVGVLLDCEEKAVSFYSVTEQRAEETLLQSYRLHITDRLFPAVWLHGLTTGNSLTISDMKKTVMET